MIEDTIKQIINMPNTYIGNAPIDLDSCQWITSLSGRQEVYFGRDTYDRAEYNIYARDKSGKTAYEVIYSIYNKLKNYVGLNFVILISRLPNFVGRDQNYRAIYALKIKYQLGGY